MSGLIRLAFLLVFIDVIGGYVSSPSWFPGGNTCLKAARLSKGKSPLRLGGRGAAVISCVSMLGGDGQDGGGRSMNELDRAKEALAKLMERKRVQGEGSTLGSTRGASHEPPSDKRVHVAVQDRPRSSSPLFGSVGAGYGTARPPSRPAEEAQAGFDLQRLHVRGVQEARRPDINQLLHDTRNNAASSSVRTSSPPAQQESGVKNAPGGRDGEQGAQGRRSQSASHQRTLDEIKKIVGGLKQVTEQQKEREIEESLSAGNR